MALSVEETAAREWTGTEIAVVGMAGRFPDAPDIDAYWTLLREGREASRSFSREELVAKGVPAAVVDDPDFVPRGPVLDGIDLFDAPFFGLSARDAAIMDPQHRLFLECAWEALEHAGYDPARAGGAVGVFAGSGMHAYLIYHLATNPALMASVGEFLVRHTGNDKDFLSTRVSYEFDLHGPSVNIQTACSTSLVAVHAAIQSLLSGESDLALAGGVSVLLEQDRGYLYQQGEILSPDGHCRAFDAQAAGTVFGSGVGLVVLKRLADAMRDGDTIHGVLLGSAVNNDGRRKVGYLAPSVDGQAAVVAEALAVAGLEPEDVGYVEAHGTGTPVGDPIEVSALMQVFGTAGGPRSVGIGSVKSNFGHLDTAAGVASMIKATLALGHGEIPPSLHFTEPHPSLGLEGGPFYVVDKLTTWERRAGRPRRAGVSSLGVGGTNAHVILEEPPAVAAGGASRPHQLICLSARTDEALDAATGRLARHLRDAGTKDLADVAHTLHVGRKGFARRRVAVVAPGDDAAAIVQSAAGSSTAPAGGRRVAFLFAGGGAQHAAMARGLYESEHVFRAALDRGLTLLRERHGLDLDPLLLHASADPSGAAAALARPSNGLPALFLVQHALSELWASWGIRPDALIGHSAGEYAAAVLAGVMSFEDALALVTLRGRLFEKLPPGGMISVAMPEEEARRRAGAAGLDIAAVNGEAMCVAAGPLDALAAFEEALKADDLEGSRLHIDVAAHSSHVEAILPEFRALVSTLALKAPALPIASNLTGAWLTASEAGDPEYWVRHLRETVRFADGLETLLADETMAMLEVGPGRTLATLARGHPRHAGRPVVTSMRHPNEAADDQATALRALGSLWACGVEVDWAGFYAGERRRRVPLPTYPFERKRYWIERGHIVAESAPIDGLEPAETPRGRRDDVADWFAVPSWRDAPAPEAMAADGTWLVFDDGSERLDAALRELVSAGARVTRVRRGDSFAADAAGYRMAPADESGYAALLDALTAAGQMPDRIVHAWSDGTSAVPTDDFFSVYHLVRAIAAHDAEPALHLDLLARGSQRTGDDDAVWNPAGALLLGPATVLPTEFEGLTARFVDLSDDVSAGALVAELRSRPATPSAAVALRGDRRLEQRTEPTAVTEVAAPVEAGPWLITGAFGGMGLAIARDCAARSNARIVLVGRSAPNARARATISEMEAAGAEVLVLRADVTDALSVRDAVAQARERFGRIGTVIHAAGVLDDAPIVLKDPARAAAVLAPKVAGTMALAAAMADDPPDALVLCSSVSARLGLAGQVDYAAANAFLDALASSADGATRVLALGWAAWQEVGMAASLSGDTVDPALDAADCTAEHAHPVLSRRSDDGSVLEAIVSETDWIADEHRLADGRALLPGSALVELARAGAAEILGDAVQLESVVLRAPAFVAGPTTVRVHVVPDGDRHAFTVATTAGGGWTVHATGHARPAPAPAASAIDGPSDDARTFTPEAPFEPQRGRLALGPRWSALRRLEVREAAVKAELSLVGTSDDEGFGLHPALLDLATGAALAIVSPEAGLWVPLGYDRVVSWAPLPLDTRVNARRVGDAVHETVRFDLELAGSDGEVVALIEGLTMRRVDAGALSRGGGQSASLAGGIGTTDGVDALDRVLRSGHRGPVLVSPIPLAELAAPAPSATRPALPAHAGDGAPAQGPRDEIEAFLATQWGELLGATSVGLHDDFFDLGGHSLLALRLFARVEKRFGSSLPLATLFEAPTVAALAERIRGGPVADAPATAGAPAPAVNGASVAPAPARAAYQHLVRIRPGGDAPAFFCVHGAGGNVLNFRDLARGMRDERAVYGLQALGVDGMSPPHGSIEEMATAYVREVRDAQPEGPYLLGGYSGGGVIAFEMARQLEEAGLEVASIVFLDTFLPGIAAPPERSAGERAGSRMRRLRDEGPGYALTWMRERVEFERWRLLEWRLTMPRRAGKPLPMSLREVSLTRAFHAAAEHYRPRPLGVPIVLFTAVDRPPGLDHVGPDLGWEPLAAAGLDVRVSAGTHDDLVREPNVGPLAASLAAVLAAATAAVAVNSGTTTSSQ